MNTFIALLRGINVSGQKKIIMAELKEVFEALGYISVTTYIQSGNVVFQHALLDSNYHALVIKKGVQERFGFDVSVLVLTREKLIGIYNANPYAERLATGEIAENKMYFTLLQGMENMEAVESLNELSCSPEEFVITKEVVYFFAANGYGKTKLSNNFFEKKLRCSATTRKLRTVLKLMEISNF